MKNLFLISIAIVISNIALAQKSKVQTAWNYMKDQQWDKAQEAIDEAAKNEATIGMCKTWYYRGEIYQGIVRSKDFAPKYPNAAQEALLSYNKAMEIDPKNEWKDDILANKAGVLNAIFNAALNAYKAKDYANALTGFEIVSKEDQRDTSVVFNCALAADGAKQMEKAKMYFEKLRSMNYDNVYVYLVLSRIYKDEKNDIKALEIIQEGRKRYPNDADLLTEELGFYLGKDDQKALASINEAISKDPNNAVLYYNAGVLYNRIACPVDEKGVAKPKPVDSQENLDKAITNYKKAVEIKPDYFDAYYNAGALYFNQGAEFVTKANDLPPTKQKEYDALIKQADEKFGLSKPFLEKAYELNPKDIGTLQSLKQLYVRTGETEKYNKIKAQLEQK